MPVQRVGRGPCSAFGAPAAGRAQVVQARANWGGLRGQQCSAIERQILISCWTDHNQQKLGDRLGRMRGGCQCRSPWPPPPGRRRLPPCTARQACMQGDWCAGISRIGPRQSRRSRRWRASIADGPCPGRWAPLTRLGKIVKTRAAPFDGIGSSPYGWEPAAPPPAPAGRCRRTNGMDHCQAFQCPWRHDGKRTRANARPDRAEQSHSLARLKPNSAETRRAGRS